MSNLLTISPARRRTSTLTTAVAGSRRTRDSDDAVAVTGAPRRLTPRRSIGDIVAAAVLASPTAAASVSARASTGSVAAAASAAVPVALPKFDAAARAIFRTSLIGAGIPDAPQLQQIRAAIAPTSLTVPTARSGSAAARRAAAAFEDAANASGCRHCPNDRCACEAFRVMLAAAQAQVSQADGLRRVTEIAGHRHMCAKSLEPNFVARLLAQFDVTDGDTFVDLGSGNGSILFQVVLASHATVKCIGVELSSHNAELSRRLWAALRPQFERALGKSIPEDTVQIITADLTQVIAEEAFLADHINTATGKGPVILCSNLLWPRGLTQFVSERMRDMPIGTRFACFDDFYPHARESARSRDPEVFELFAMTDGVWPSGAVEWTLLTGKFYCYEKVSMRRAGADDAVRLA